jgi:hypothetical protein
MNITADQALDQGILIIPEQVPGQHQRLHRLMMHQQELQLGRQVRHARGQPGIIPVIHGRLIKIAVRIRTVRITEQVIIQTDLHQDRIILLPIKEVVVLAGVIQALQGPTIQVRAVIRVVPDLVVSLPEAVGLLEVIVVVQEGVAVVHQEEDINDLKLLFS